jgi:hypothetical protein
VVGFTTPLVSPAVTGHLETDTTITIVNHALGVDFITGDTRIRHTLTLHSTGVVTVLTDINEVDGFILYVGDLVVINIGLVITPATHIDVTYVDNRQRFIDLGNIVSLDDDSTIVDVAISGITIECTISASLPDLEFGISRYNGEFVNTVDELNVIGNSIVLFDFISHSVVDY